MSNPIHYAKGSMSISGQYMERDKTFTLNGDPPSTDGDNSFRGVVTGNTSLLIGGKCFYDKSGKCIHQNVYYDDPYEEEETWGDNVVKLPPGTKFVAQIIQDIGLHSFAVFKIEILEGDRHNA